MFLLYKKDILFRLTILSVLIYLLFLSTFQCWWGGFSFGPRLLVDIIPFLCLFLIPFLQNNFYKKITLKGIFFLFLGWPLIVQLIGVYIYDSTWNTLHKKDLHRACWSIRDSQLNHYFKRIYKKVIKIYEDSLAYR